MRIDLLKRSPSELKIEIEGEGHTFCNLLQKTLLDDKDVEVAGYDQPHPLIPRPTLYLRAKGEKRAEKLLEKALEGIVELTEEFKKKFSEATTAK